MNLKRLRVYAHCVPVLFALFSGDAARADDKANGKILFLTLKLDNSSVRLVDSKIVPGHLKIPRGPVSGELSYELYSDSAILYKGAIDNPLVRRFEYQDPNNAGKLKTKVITSPEATISLRVPYSDSIRRLTFFRAQKGIDSDSKGTRSIIGTVDLASVHRGEK